MRDKSQKLTAYDVKSRLGRVDMKSPSGVVDAIDHRHGAYDPVSKDGMPQGQQIKDKATPHEKAQWGADVRADPLPGTEPVLPEGLIRSPEGPLNPRTGRRGTK
jgi:hypothetical protein